MDIYSKSEKLKRSILIFLMIFFLPGIYNQLNAQTENSVAINLLDGNMEWGACPDIIPNGCKVTLLHGDLSKNNADVLFKFEPDTDIPEHWHSSAERMILLKGELEVTYEGEDTKTLKAGHYAYGPEKKPHEARCNGEGPCLLYIAFIKPVDAFPGKP